MAEAENPVVFIQIETASATQSVSETLPEKLEDGNKTGEESQKQKVVAELDTTKQFQYQEKRIRCPECKYYTTENEEKMTRHIRKMHRGENPFQCYMCDYSTYNKICFEEHVRVHQGIKPYKCSFCPHRTVSKKNIKKHELVHRPDNPLKCQHCEYFARHRRSLEFHMRKFHLEAVEAAAANETSLGKWSCQRCSVKFENRDALRTHNKSQRKCKECDYVSCSRSFATLHAINKHGAPPKKPLRKKDATFKCTVCKWSSSHVARVLLHLIHHPNQTVNENIFDLSILRKHGIIQ